MLNKVMLIGNVGADPEIRKTNDGLDIATFSLATSEKKDKTEWHKIVAFGKQANFAENYIKKGSKLYVEGQLQTRKWTDKKGIDRYKTEIVVNDLRFWNEKQENKEQNYDDKAANGYQPEPNILIDVDDDLPF